MAGPRAGVRVLVTIWTCVVGLCVRLRCLAAAGMDPEGVRRRPAAAAPALDGLHPLVARLQVRFARRLLQALEAGDPPQALLALLGRHDLVYALSAFAARLGLRSASLLDPLDPVHPRTVAVFRRGLALVRRLEALGRASALPSEPVWASLARGPDVAGLWLGRFESAVVVARTFEETSIPFPVYEALRADVLRDLERWHELDEGYFEQAFRLQLQYRDLHRLFLGECREIDALVSRAPAEGCDADVTSFARDEAAIVQAVASGRCPADLALGALAELKQRLAAALGVDLDHEERLRGHRALLGLDEGASLDEIKHAYWAFAALHHPDKEPDPALKRVKEERLKVVTRAYAELRAECIRSKRGRGGAR